MNMRVMPAAALLSLVAVVSVRAAEPKVAGTEVPVPHRTKFVKPEFPPEALARGLRGIVVIELVIGPDGKVQDARVQRSVPPFDDAAVAAVKQWEYEVTKVDGKPVSVKLTLPISFALKLPELARTEGVPELRQGAAPAVPTPAASASPVPAKVTAEVELTPQGTVAEAQITSGDSPYIEAVLQSFRTWVFVVAPDAPAVGFTVEADFRADAPNSGVALRLSGVRPAAPKETRTDVGASPVPPAPPSPAAAPVPPAVPPGTPPASGVQSMVAPPPPPVPSPAPPAPAPVASPRTVAPPPPPTEVIPAPRPATPPPPPAAPPVAENGASTIRDITLASGVPDLVKGRRPTVPPLARMHTITGLVQVRFSVDPAGGTSITEVTGPELLKEAARQMVTSWEFRRTSAERLRLVAAVEYTLDGARAKVKPEE